MRGQDMINLIWLLATPANGDARKVQMFMEDGKMYMGTYGCSGPGSYSRPLGPSRYKELLKACEWDERFLRWRVLDTKAVSEPIAAKKNVNKYNYIKTEKPVLKEQVVQENLDILEEAKFVTPQEEEEMTFKALEKQGFRITRQNPKA